MPVVERRSLARRRALAEQSARPQKGWKKLTSPLKLGAAALLLAGASATTLGEAGLTAALAAAQNGVDAIAGRSPGLRTEANMSKGKPRMVAPARVARALPRVRAPLLAAAPGPVGGLLPAPLGGADDAPGVIIGPVVPPPILEGPGGLIFAGPAEGPGGGAVFGPGFGPPPIGGGGGGIILLPPGPPAGTTPVPPEEEPGGPVIVTPPGEVPGGPGIVTPPGPSAPIPEPANWTMLILGFFGMGAFLRRAPRLHAHA